MGAQQGNKWIVLGRKALRTVKLLQSSRIIGLSDIRLAEFKIALPIVRRQRLPALKASDGFVKLSFHVQGRTYHHESHGIIGINLVRLAEFKIALPIVRRQRLPALKASDGFVK